MFPISFSSRDWVAAGSSLHGRVIQALRWSLSQSASDARGFRGASWRFAVLRVGPKWRAKVRRPTGRRLL